MGLRKRNSFTIDSFNDLLDDIIQKRVSASTAERAIVYYLESEEFMRMLFNPPEEIVILSLVGGDKVICRIGKPVSLAVPACSVPISATVKSLDNYCFYRCEWHW